MVVIKNTYEQNCHEEGIKLRNFATNVTYKKKTVQNAYLKEWHINLLSVIIHNQKGTYGFVNSRFMSIFAKLKTIKRNCDSQNSKLNCSHISRASYR